MRPRLNASQGRHPTVVFDVDDTLVDLRTPLMRTLNTYVGKRMHWREWSDYALHTRYGLSISRFLELIVRERLLERAKLEVGAMRAVSAARQAGFRVEIWTARAFHPNARAITARTLAPLGIKPEEIVLFGIGASKARALAKRPDVALFVDDSPTHVGEAASNGDAARSMLITRPWNASHSLRRSPSLDAIAMHVQQMSAPDAHLPAVAL